MMRVSLRFGILARIVPDFGIDRPAIVAKSKLKELVITDSIQPTKDVLDTGNVRALPIAPLIGEAIARTASEESVSSLFD